MAMLRQGHALALGYRLAKLLIVGHFPVHGLGCKLGRYIAAQIGWRCAQPGPDQDVVGLRVAAGNAQGEGVMRQRFASAGPGGQGAHGRGKARGNQKAPAIGPGCEEG